MAQDPAFLFYPGDYLRDTQILSEAAQVAYDRIMCEHMRNISDDMNNICISKKTLDFFIKRLTEQQKEEIFHVLDKIDGGFQITWVAESIAKRKAYSDSRRKNRSKTKKSHDKHMKTYDKHMENVNENVNENIIKEGIEKKPKIPTEQEFIEYASRNKPNVDIQEVKLKYRAWVENDWKDGKGNAIKKWTSKLLQTLPYIKETKLSHRTDEEITAEKIALAESQSDL